MVVAPESPKYQPVDIRSDLFYILHQWAYLNLKWLSDMFTIIIVQIQTIFSIICQIYTFVLHYQRLLSMFLFKFETKCYDYFQSALLFNRILLPIYTCKYTDKQIDSK
jgi:hypothetical protein